MIRRCENPNDNRYRYYGAKGVKVCSRWRNSFQRFLSDVGKIPKGKTLDRKETGGNYEPGNVRWADKVQQANNKTNNRVLELDGRRMTLAQWGVESGIHPFTIHCRLKRGWTLARAIAKPPIFKPNCFGRGILEPAHV